MVKVMVSLKSWSDFKKLLTLTIEQEGSQDEIDTLLDDLSFANMLIEKLKERMKKQ